MNTYKKMGGGQQLMIALSSGKSGSRRERHGHQELRGVKKVITWLLPHKKVGPKKAPPRKVTYRMSFSRFTKPSRRFFGIQKSTPSSLVLRVPHPSLLKGGSRLFVCVMLSKAKDLSDSLVSHRRPSGRQKNQQCRWVLLGRGGFQ
jgi:hypothetical protein